MRPFIFVLTLSISLYHSSLGRTSEGKELIGTRPSQWHSLIWLNSEPIELSDLKGKVILIRWWTGPECPYCRASAPALREFDQLYRDRGLVVIGLYHHKSLSPLVESDLRDLIQEYGFEFPVAIDPEWTNLNAWWFRGREHSWTSVSFLLDREGIIRYIHPGGQYVKPDPAYQELKDQIEFLLSSPTHN